ncbi:MAG: hypothetical protein KF781_02455 [Chitinophagaceae bacterium]|nr:hypothetical protein [Chitinophagaceae bacterium]MCW5904371.1 hypothetical protein [Chitinophagaceae bacterium]
MNKLFKTFLAGLAVLSLVSCKKNNYVVDKDALTLPEYAQLILPNYAPRAYYVDNSGTSEYSIPLGLTNVSNADRTIGIDYISPTGAAAGTQYNAPTSVVVKAGEAVATIGVKGIFAGYNGGRVDSLKVKIGSISSGGKSMEGKDSVWLIMRQYCDVILADLGGAYNTMEGSYGPYISEVLNLVPTGPTSATGTVTNIYDSGIDAVAVFSWDTPTSFSVTIAAQPTPYTSGGLPLFVRTNASAASTFSSCDKTITLNLQLFTSAGIYDSWTSAMSK